MLPSASVLHREPTETRFVPILRWVVAVDGIAPIRFFTLYRAGIIQRNMTVAKSTREESTKRKDCKAKDNKQKPEWTHGLKRMYDSVVEEPLPDSFKELLSKLDAKE